MKTFVVTTYLSAISAIIVMLARYGEPDLPIIGVKAFFISYIVIGVVSAVLGYFAEKAQTEREIIVSQHENACQVAALVQRRAEYIHNAETEEKFSRRPDLQGLPNMVNTLREAKENARYWRAEAQKTTEQIWRLND